MVTWILSTKFNILSGPCDLPACIYMYVYIDVGLHVHVHVYSSVLTHNPIHVSLFPLYSTVVT